MTADWGALQRAIDGHVVLPGSADYESVRKPVMARFEHLRPVAVVQCATPADIAATLAVVRGLRLPTAIRSGGHSVAGRSSTDGVVLDVTPMRSVVVAGDVATVGAGVRLGDLYDALAEHGLTIPAGCGPSVGIAGLTLGGGLGILGRKHGLTCDHLLAAQVVLADGRIVECDEHRDEELFWALRGAGGGHFGVVTSLVFRILPAPATTVFHLVWPPAAAAAVVQAWQTWAPDAPDELDATLRLTAAGDGERAAGVEVVGSVLDGEADAAELLGELIDRVGADPMEASRRHMAHRAAKRYLEGLGSVEDRERLGPERSPQPGYLYSKSEFFRRPLPGRDDRDAGRAPHPRVGPRPVARGRLPAMGGRLQPRARRRDRLRPPRRTLPGPAPGPGQPRPRTGGARRRARLAGALVDAGASMGIRGRVPELPGCRLAGLGARLPREELRPPAARQGGLRPGRLLPLSPVASVAASRMAISTFGVWRILNGSG
jgi:hypothetical protein